jgi:threonyl-tRNA synthetase
MSNKNRLDQIRRTAAEILAQAVSDFDFKTFVIQGGPTPTGFYYDFIFVNPFKEEMLPLIEERMRKIVADDEEIKVHEMVPVSAASFMRHNRRPYPAHFVEICQDPIVQVIQIGNFVDHVHGTFLERTGELPAFKLLRLEQRSDLYFKGERKKVLRIVGVAEESKDALKAFVKKNKEWFGIDHLVMGEKMGLFKYDVNRDENYLEKVRIYWTGAGEALLHNIYQYWRKLHLDEKFELIVTDSVQITRGHKKLYKITHQSCVSGPVRYAEYRSAELNGRTFKGPFLTAREKNEIFTIKRSLFSSVERMIAIILESHEKDLSQKKELLSKMVP